MVNIVPKISIIADFTCAPLFFCNVAELSIACVLFWSASCKISFLLSGVGVELNRICLEPSKNSDLSNMTPGRAFLVLPGHFLITIDLKSIVEVELKATQINRKQYGGIPLQRKKNQLRCMWISSVYTKKCIEHAVMLLSRALQRKQGVTGSPWWEQSATEKRKKT